MRWLSEQDNRGRVVLITATLCMWLLILLAFKYYGYEETWRIWNVPTASPPFVDFRLIPGSAESFRQGFEPTIKNPEDPFGRIFNYPTFWRIFFYTNISQDDTIWISVLMIMMFFTGIFLFPGTLRIIDAIAVLFVVFSPASMLLYERGNVDLIIFVICVSIVIASDYKPSLTALLLVFGAVVKLFPFFGVGVLLRESKNTFLKYFLGCFMATLAYMYLTIDSMRVAWNSTMRGDELSYGTDVLVKRWSEQISLLLASWFSTPVIEQLKDYVPLMLALMLIGVLGLSALREKAVAVASERNLAAFRMGASVYVGTFLLGNNWDYRLAFLVLVVPQLMHWLAVDNKKLRMATYIGMTALLVSCWHFLLYKLPFYPFFGSAHEFWIVFDETANWVLFADLTFLLFASMPDWVKELARFRLPNKNSAQVM